VCAHAAAVVAKQERRDRDGGDREASMGRTIRAQSAALDAADAHIRELRRRLDAYRQGFR